MRAYANRFAQRKAQRIVRDGIYVAQNLSGHSAVIFKAGRGVGDVVFGFDDWLAGIAAFQVRQVRRLLANSLGQAEKYAPAILRRGLRPSAGIERCLRGGYSSIDVVFIRFGNFGNDFLGGRIVNGENSAAVRFHKFAVDVHLMFARARF